MSEVSQNDDRKTTLTDHLIEKDQPRKKGIFTATSIPPPALPGFKNFNEQVAGHLETHQVPCFMIDDDGHILKILDKGKKLVYMEQEFYEKIFHREKHKDEWVELKKFIPSFYGTTTLLHNEQKFSYLKLQNLVHGLRRPCIMDMKIGKITYDPFATADKIHRELIRYDYQAQLGFRITGFKVFKAKTGEVELYDRFHCKRFKPDDMEPTFAYFFDLEDFPERILLVKKMLEKLQRLKNWFESQKQVKFFCTSLLIAYDALKCMNSKSKTKMIIRPKTKEDIVFDKSGIFIGDKRLKDSKESEKASKIICNDDNLIQDENSISDSDVVVSMIDFTHTFIDFEGMSDSIDENYIYGLQTIINLFENMLLNSTYKI